MARVVSNEQYFPVSMAMQPANNPQPKKPVFPPHGGTKKKGKKR